MLLLFKETGIMKHSAGFTLIVFIVAVFYGITGCTGPNYHKNYKPENAAVAVKKLKPLAEQGNADAQFNLGSLYYQGWGVSQDYKEAVKWFRRAAEQNHAYAQSMLGTIYTEGVQGVIGKDYSHALMWFIFAASRGDTNALELRDSLAAKMTPAQIIEAQRLAREFKPETAYAKLLSELKALGEQGDADAQLKIGLMYYNGQGTAQNYAEAIQWFKKSALQGNALAQSNIGYMYEKGEGAPQDYAEAAKWYRQAAKRGNMQAQSTLGYMYEKGLGVNQSDIKALMWFNLAAAQGDIKAKASRDRITSWMPPAEIAYAQRLASEFKIMDK
jgi:TPR repeat protein